MNGKPDGYWKTFYENGVLKSEGDRVQHQLSGVWKFYDPQGRLNNTITYAGGKRNGVAGKYDEEGRLLMEEWFGADLKEGLTTEYYPDGKVQRTVPFVAGKEDGKGHEYAEDGRLTALLEYRAGVLRKRENINRYDASGRRQGPWKEFHPNGKVRSEGGYVDDKKQGIFKEYDVQGNLKNLVKYDLDEVQAGAEQAKLLDIKNTYHASGKVASIGSYSKEGKKEGLFRQFDAEGKPSGAAIYNGDQLMSAGSVNDVGALEGPWVEYYTTGEKRAEGLYKGGKKDGAWTFYHRSGAVEQKGNYQAGLPQGAWVWYYESGARHREENYRKGKEEGASVEYDEDGAVITQGEYIDGLKDGKWTYHVGDHREEGAYKDGLKDGLWVHTYDSGRKSFIGEFVNGDPKGKVRWYWPNGQLKMEGRYTGGLQNGDFNYFNEYGALLLTIKYKNGSEIRIGDTRVPAPFEPGGFEP